MTEKPIHLGQLHLPALTDKNLKRRALIHFEAFCLACRRDFCNNSMTHIAYMLDTHIAYMLDTHIAYMAHIDMRPKMITLSVPSGASLAKG